MIPVLPIALAAGLFFAWKKAKPTSKTPTTEQKIVFDNALVSETSPEKLVKLSEAFKEEGLGDQAKVLETRAAWFSAPPEEKQARREAFRVGMASQEPEKVEALAEAFAEQAATGAATDLKKYAAGLRQGVMVATKKPTGALAQLQKETVQGGPVSTVPKMRTMTVSKPKAQPASEERKETTPGINKRGLL